MQKLFFENETFEHTDFMMKFIRMNSSQFQELFLRNVKQLSDMVHMLKECRMVQLHLESCDMIANFLPKLFDSLKEMSCLK